MIRVICFSKDRPMQVDAYIASLSHFSGIPLENVTILYTDSGDINYDTVKENYPAVNWVRETNFFSDLKNTVSAAEDYILFGCDDVIFMDYFDLNDSIKALLDNQEAFGFSLRLGANLHSLPKLQSQSAFLKWNWREAPTGHWSYPWDVSATIFKKSQVQKLLDKYDDLTNPNRLEAYIAEKIHADLKVGPSELLCHHQSKCVTLTINRVQDEFANDFDDTKESDPEQLFKAYVAGRRLDWTRFMGQKFSRIHIDSTYFTLVDYAPNLEVPKYAANSNHVLGNAKYSLPIKILFWGIANRVKERLRPILPRKVISTARRFL